MLEAIVFNFDLLIAALVFIAALAAAIKGMPIVWNWVKNLFRFLSGMERIAEVPRLVEEHTVIKSTVNETDHKVDQVVEKVSAIADSVRDVADDLRQHMNEEERMRSEEKNMVASIVETVERLSEDVHSHVLDVADTVFRQVVFADPVAYYIVHWNPVDKDWDWVWGNTAYLNLTGLTGDEARQRKYWDMVHPDDRERVFEAAARSGELSVPLDVDFTCVNLKTGEEFPVRAISWPMTDHHGDAVGFLGAIQRLYSSSVD